MERAEGALTSARRTGWGRAVTAVLLRPRLWAIGITQVFALAERGWWRRPPFLPVPDREYLRFRLQTQYGDPDHEPEPFDLVTYLEWCRGYRASLR